MKVEILAIVLGTVCAAALPRAASAARIDLAPAQGDPGGTVEMCGFLSDNVEVIALQMDLQWDGRCVAPVLDGGKPQCSTNPGTGKSVLTALLGQQTRIILIALSNDTPIPNGPLFCCAFVVSQIPPSSSCPMTFAGVSGSAKGGRRIGSILAQGATLSVRVAQEPTTRGQDNVGAPAAPGAGVTLQADQQPSTGTTDKAGTGAVAEATVVKRGSVPTAAAPALAPVSSNTPSVEGNDAPLLPADHPAEPADVEIPPADAPSTPTLGRRSTPVTTTTIAAATPRTTMTRTIPAATQTSTAVVTRATGTPTPSKQ